MLVLVVMTYSFSTLEPETGSQTAEVDRTEVPEEMVREIEDAFRLATTSPETNASSGHATEPQHILHENPKPSEVSGLEADDASIASAIQAMEAELASTASVSSDVPAETIVPSSEIEQSDMADASTGLGVSNAEMQDNKSGSKGINKATIKERIKKYIAKHRRDVALRKKDPLWQIGVGANALATGAFALFAPIAFPIKSLVKTSLRAANYGYEKANKKIHRKRLNDEQYSVWLTKKETKSPRGSKLKRLLHGTSAIGVAATVASGLFKRRVDKVDKSN